METKSKETQVEINTGNVEVLKLKLLADIAAQLKRIADKLEAK